MPEPASEPGLQATALRYAAGDLTPDEVAAFEARLAVDQEARDALSEAVRLSAAAIGQKPLAPHPSFRTAIRARLGLIGYRGHPLVWVGLGAAAVAACTLIGLSLSDRPDGPPEAAYVTPAAPPPGGSIPVPREAEPAPPEATPLPGDPGSSVAAEHHPTAGACCDESHRSVAEIWADLSTPEHVEKAHDDELRRRQHIRNLAYPHHASATAKATGTTDSPPP